MKVHKSITFRLKKYVISRLENFAVMQLGCMRFADIVKASKNPKFQDQRMFDVSMSILWRLKWIGSVMPRFYSTMNSSMRWGLQDTTGPFEILRLYGPMMVQETWVNPLEIISENGLQNGCGHVRNASKSILVTEGGMEDIAAVNAGLCWLMSFLNQSVRRAKRLNPSQWTWDTRLGPLSWFYFLSH
jgi:hypothetical protein